MPFSKARCCAESICAGYFPIVGAPSSAALLEHCDTLISLLHNMPGRWQPAQQMAAVNSLGLSGTNASLSPDVHMLDDTCLSGGASHVVCLPMQLICMAKKRGTKVINVVRREDVKQELKDLGCASLMSGLHAFRDGMPRCLPHQEQGLVPKGVANMTIFAVGCSKLRVSRAASLTSPPRGICYVCCLGLAAAPSCVRMASDCTVQAQGG